MSFNVSTNSSGMVTVMIKNGSTSMTKELTPTEALYYSDILKVMANTAFKHNSKEDYEDE